MSFWMAMAPFLGGAASGVGSYFGAVEDRKASEATNAANERINQRNIDLQREFARSGIQWRMEDAKKAGIHPLAALGAQGATFSPSAIGVEPDRSRGRFARDMGQNISRALTATMNTHQREMNALQMDALRTQIDGQRIENAYNAKRLEKLSQVGPGLPTNSGMGSSLVGAGQGNAYVVEQPVKRFHSEPGNPAKEAGEIPDFSFARTNTGLSVVPSADVKERIEDNLFMEAEWFFRNKLKNMPYGPRPPSREQYPLPRGYRWEWNRWAMEFQPKKVRNYFNEAMKLRKERR